MKIKILVVLIFLSSTSIFTQEGEDVGWVARFGIAGGINPAWIIPNLNPVNAEIKKLGLSELSNSGLMLWGGGGYAYIMLIDNLRLGGIGLSGSTSTSGFVVGYDKEVVYNYGLGGLTVEYTLPFIKNIAVSPGFIIGGGNTSIEIYQNRDNFSWSGTWNEIASGSNSSNINRKLSNIFFTITPTLNIDLPINRFIAIRLGGGYVFSFNDDWKVDNDKTLRSVPSDLNNNSFFISTGIYFGFFAF